LRDVGLVVPTLVHVLGARSGRPPTRGTAPRRRAARPQPAPAARQFRAPAGGGGPRVGRAAQRLPRSQGAGHQSRAAGFALGASVRGAAAGRPRRARHGLSLCDAGGTGGRPLRLSGTRG
jgi:hypothetical protein